LPPQFNGSSNTSTGRIAPFSLHGNHDIVAYCYNHF
jgi:hypothetical protein